MFLSSGCQRANMWSPPPQGAHRVAQCRRTDAPPGGHRVGTDEGDGPQFGPLAVSVLEGLGRWEAGRSAGGMDPQRKGCGRLQDRAGETSSK